MMKRKLLVIMLAIVMVFTCAAGLAACGTKGDGGGGGNGTTYTVTFETVGGTAINPVEVKAGNTVARPADPTKTGAEFIDWFTTSTYEGEPYDFSTPVNSNLTLYAQWSDENYAVVFDVNGGSPVIDYATYLYGTELDEPDEPERVGYTFTGWYTDVKCTKKASFPYEVTGHSRFYAGWESTREVTVNFKIAMLQGDTRDINYDEEILAPITITAGEELTQPENPKDISYLDKNGANHELKFSYWNFEPVYGNYSDAVLFPVRTTDVEEIMLYAVYVEVGEGDVYASLTVHPNNGEKETVMYGVQGEAIAISNLNEHDPAPFYSDKGLPRKPGYEATGYFKTSDFQSGTVYEIPFVLKNEQNDVYIRWEKKDDLTVTFDYNFDSIEDMTATFAYRGLIVRPENKMVTGYTFDGWYYTLYIQCISAMHRMLSLTKGDKGKQERIKKKQLHGFELQSNMFAVACANMILRKDGNSNLVCCDFLKENPAQVQLKGATVGLMNPPYSQGTTADPSQYELSFVEHLLNSLTIGARAAVIVPQSAMTGKSNAEKTFKQNILKHHTLEGVITCNTSTFYGVGTNPVIAVFTAHEPHPAEKLCKFIDFRDDGYEVRAHVGLVECDSAKDKKQHLLDVWRSHAEATSKFCVESTVTFEDEWLHSFFYFNDEIPTDADFEKAIGDYLTFEFSMIMQNREYLFNGKKKNDK